MLRYTLTGRAISKLGDSFVVRMHNDEMGEYEMTNHVVGYEPDRYIAWEPQMSVASRTADADDIGVRSGHVWAFRLEPDGPTSTIVTETFDCTRSPAWLQKAVKGGARWVDSMETTLARLDEQCTARLHRRDIEARTFDLSKP